MTTTSYERQKVWRIANPEKHKQHLANARAVANAKDPLWQRKASLIREYGITLDTYNEMKNAQGGVCAICEQPETVTQNGKLQALAVDHNHDTGKVRGLLCVQCNMSIGGGWDNIKRLQSAIEYLENYDKENM